MTARLQLAPGDKRRDSSVSLANFATDITALVRSVTNRVEVDSHGTAENQPQATRHVPSALGLDRVAAHISELLAARVAEDFDKQREGESSSVEDGNGRTQQGSNNRRRTSHSTLGHRGIVSGSEGGGDGGLGQASQRDELLHRGSSGLAGGARVPGGIPDAYVRRDRARDRSTSITRNGITHQNTVDTVTRPSLSIASAGANDTTATATTACKTISNSTTRLPWRGLPASQDTAAEDATNNSRIISATQAYLESAAAHVSTVESDPIITHHPRIGDVCHPGQRKAAIRAEKQMKTMIAGDTKS